ncbi:MAG: NADH:ubiquinone oxidoreductase subunit NDUFA12 [Alphaproteobacteria bacterium]
MSLGTRLYTMLHGQRVGSDPFGNVYYQERRAGGGPRRRRWVIYKGEVEASRVPPEWHAWLHYVSDDVPGPEAGKPARPWQKEHVPNLTGTALAYRPPGHTLEGGRRAPTAGDYEPWSPPED